MIEWTDMDGWYQTTVPKLGLVQIHKAANGWAVDINGKRAWSAWRASLDSIKFEMGQKLRQWQYLNTFIEGGQ